MHCQAIPLVPVSAQLPSVGFIPLCPYLLSRLRHMLSSSVLQACLKEHGFLLFLLYICMP